MSLYTYRAKCSRVIDGDTIELEMIDLGFGLRQFGIPDAPLRFRLAGIDAYETRLGRDTTDVEKAIGLRAKEWLKERIEGEMVRVQTVRSGAKGNFGRWLAYVFDDGDDHEALTPEKSINRELLEGGFAVVSDYADGSVFIAMGYERKD